MAKFARIEALLGASVGAITETTLELLVKNSMAEDHDLEFKAETYADTEPARKELAKDVAALANTVGGLLIIGVRAPGHVADELTPVDISGEEEGRMRNIVAAHSAPVPQYDILTVATVSDSQRGYYLLAVPRSPFAPHAVRVSQHHLGYPRRDGSTTRWLAESEVATAYRDRLAWARRDAERLDDVRREGERELVSRKDAEFAWLSVALVPSLPGAMVVDRDSIRDVEANVTPGGSLELWNTGSSATPKSRAGYRRVVTRLEDTSGRPTYGAIHLHTDGSGYVGVKVGTDREPWSSLPPGDAPATYVFEDDITRSVFNALRILVSHAVERSGASGDAALSATLYSKLPARIVTDLNGRNQSEALASIPVGLHSVNLDAVHRSTSELASVAGAVITDLLQSFGVTESQTVSRDGLLRPDRFIGGNERDTVERLGLPIEDAR